MDKFAHHIASIDTLQTVCGTALFMAPEIVLHGDRTHEHYDYKVDMWALGVMLYLLCVFFIFHIVGAIIWCYRLSGHYPFPKDDLKIRLPGVREAYDRRSIDWRQFPKHISAEGTKLYSLSAMVFDGYSVQLET